MTYIKTEDICRELGVSRMTLYNWEKKGHFTPPRNLRGDRVLTEEQFKEMKKAFTPGGTYQWHFNGEPSR